MAVRPGGGHAGPRPRGRAAGGGRRCGGAAAVAGLLLVRRQHGLGWAALIGTVTLALAVQLWAGPAALATVRPAPPARARIRVALERAETAVLLGCGVTALATFDAYGLAFAVVR